MTTADSMSFRVFGLEVCGGQRKFPGGQNISKVAVCLLCLCKMSSGMRSICGGCSMLSSVLAVLTLLLLTGPLVCTASTPAGTTLNLFVPAETTACLDLIPGPCVLIEQAALNKDTCARANIAQLAADISVTDKSQACAPLGEVCVRRHVQQVWLYFC